MKISLLNKTFQAIIVFSLCNSNLYAQDEKVSVSQNPKFENLLNEKRKINASITVNDIYKIQIYNGDSETSKKTLNDFKRDFLSFDGTIVFYTPAYKVWVGNFKTRIEAERNLMLFKKKYPNAFVIKPYK
jgi:hypothetical protein